MFQYFGCGHVEYHHLNLGILIGSLTENLTTLGSKYTQSEPQVQFGTQRFWFHKQTQLTEHYRHYPSLN